MKIIRNTFASLVLQLFLAVLVFSVITASAVADQVKNSRAPAVSGPLPEYYPKRFENVGKITDIENRYTWQVSGKKYNVSPNLSIHSLVTNYSSMYSIKKGMNIAFRINSMGHIMEVWELKENSIDLN